MTARRAWLAVLVLVVALLIGYFFEGGGRGAEEPRSAGESAGERAAQPAVAPSATATPVAAGGGAAAARATPVEVERNDELPYDAQAVARNCLIIDGKQTLSNPEADTGTLTALVRGFFEGVQTESHVFEHEITFVDSDGVTKRLHAHRSDELQQFRVRLFRKVPGGRDQPEELPYELRDLNWEDVRTRYLGNKERLRERTLAGVHSEDDDKVGLIETIDGKQVEVNLQVGGKSLGCSYDPFSKKNRCDCSDVPVE